MRARGPSLSLVVAALALALPSSAPANGRFPDAQQLVVNPTNDDDMAVQTTYGFIHTRDAGASWQWTCEESAFYGGILDPPIALFGDGALIAGVFDGLVVSTPDRCDNRLVDGELEEKYVVDVSVIKGEPDRAIILHSNGTGGSMFQTRVFASTDAGATWSQRGVDLPTNFLGLTLDAAPSDENTLYVSGFEVVTSSEYEGRLAVSTDGGATWTVKPIPGSQNDAGPYLAAVDPVDPDVAYVRLASMAGQLLVTKDAGDTWETIFEGKGKLLGFALSPDGSEIRVGGDEDGIWGASATDYAFTSVNEVGVRCLTWTPYALFACGREANAEFTIAKSFDAGLTFEPVHHLSCLDGPDPACAADSGVQTACPGPWAAQKQILKTEDCDGGAGASSGSSTSQGGGSADGDGEGGCSCSSPAGRAGSAALPALGLAAALLARRRRRA